jgi:hypothetical protein
MAKKIGLSKTRPVNEARPLGVPRPKLVSKKKIDETQKDVDSSPIVEVDSTNVVNENPAPEQAATAKETKMTFTLKGLSKNKRTAFYAGAATTLRFALSVFPNKTAPKEFEVPDGIFAEPKTAAAKLSKEERKALRAAKPKPTLAEKRARLEARIAKMKEQEAAEQNEASM